MKKLYLGGGMGIGRSVLISKDIFTLVDDDIFDWLNQWRWHITNGYIIRKQYGKRGENKKPENIYIHRLIMGTPNGYVTDHINGNKLDNQRDNLRIGTQSQNMMNRGKQKNNTSGYKGVHWNKQHQKWQAVVKFDGKQKHLGYFDNAFLASLAYIKGAKELYGEFSGLITN